MTRGQYAGALLVLAATGLPGGILAAGRSGSSAAAEDQPRVVRPRTVRDVERTPMPRLDPKHLQEGPPTLVYGRVAALEAETSADGTVVMAVINPGVPGGPPQPGQVFVTDAVLVSILETAFAMDEWVWLWADRRLSDEGKELYVANATLIQD